MTAVECLVMWKEHRKVMYVGGNRDKQDVHNVFMASEFGSSVPASASVIIQLYNKKFCDFVDMSENDRVKELDKLNVVVKAQETQAEDALHAFHVIPEPSVRQNDGVYRLPTPTYDVVQCLRDLQQSDTITSDIRNRIIKWLHADILQYDLYPGKKNLYQEAARQLVYVYPVLKDSTGTGFDSWQRALKFRTKNQRKKLQDIPAVVEQRRRSTVFKQLACNDANPPKKRCFRMANSVPAIQSTGHDATFSERQAWIHNTRPTVQEVVSWSWLVMMALYCQVQEEFVQHTGKNAENELLKLVNETGEAFMRLAQRKKNLAASLLYVNGKIHEARDLDEQKYQYSIGVIYALTGLLKENASDLFTSGENAVYPSVVAVDPFQLEPCSVCVEGSTYTVQDSITAVATAFALYWVFNLRFAPALSGTFHVLEYYFGLSGKKKQGVLVSRVISDVRAINPTSRAAHL